MTHHAIDDITDAVSRELGRLAAVGKLQGANKYGVVVLYSPKSPQFVKFVFVTHDDIGAEFVLDLKRMSGEYLAEEAYKIRQRLDDERAMLHSAQLPEFIH
jgi:hypothetical protein